MQQLSRVGLILIGVLLGLSATLSRAAESDEVRYWAPGVVNPEAGTIEMDLRFLRSRAEMQSDWFFALRLTGNSSIGGGSSTILGMVFCPPGDERDFLVLARGPNGVAYLAPETPAMEPGKTSRVAIVWGDGQFQFWIDGKLSAKANFKGPLALLPQFFQAGRLGAFAVERLRVSDQVRPASSLKAMGELESDDHTTLLISGVGATPALGHTSWQQKGYAVSAFPDRVAAALVVPESKSLLVPWRVVNFTSNDATVDIRCDVSNRAGRAVANQSYQLPVKAGARYEQASISLPALAEPGYYNAKLAVKTPGGSESVYEWSFVVQAQDAAKPGKLADYLGHHHHFEKPDLFTQLGIHWHRAWASERGFLWCVVEPEPGKFQWDDADRAVSLSQQSGVQVLGVLGYPPTWASTISDAEVKRLEAKAAKSYLKHPERFQPRDLKEWEAYVRAVVTRYHDRVKYWEIYNEVDFHPPALFASFSGSTEDYGKLLEVAYKVVKEVDPTCMMMTAGFSLTPGVTDVAMPADLMKLGAAKSMDIFAVHGYAPRESIQKSLTAVQEAKPGVPLWQTERQYMGGYLDENQAVQMAFWCLDKGFVKYFFHESDSDRNFGCLKPTPYYAVTAETARQIRLCDRYAGLVDGVGDAATVWSLQRSDGGMLYVFAVNSGKVKVTLEPAGTNVSVTDLYGESVFRGKLEAGHPLELSGLDYVVSPVPLKIVKLEREVGNLLVNPGFEIRDGDVYMDEAAARPAFWALSPADADRKCFSFVKGGHTGDWAMRLKSPAGSKGVWVTQALTIDDACEWTLSAWVRVEKDKTLPVKFYLQVPGVRWPTQADAVSVTGTGDWQRLELNRVVKSPGVKGTIMIGIQEGDGMLELDDVELVPAGK